MRTFYVIITQNMSAIVIIPSRYSSTRFPGKPLCLISGKPMIQHVYEKVKKSRLVSDIFVATDNTLIFNAVEGFGGKAIMTSENHESGTDRVAEAVEKLLQAGYKDQDMEIVVNVQGDEPMIMPEMVDDVIELMNDNRASIGTLAKRISDTQDIADPNIVKVVFDEDYFAIYFSRAPIPYYRDKWKSLTQIKDDRVHVAVFKHIGIYAYRRDVLLRFSKLKPSRLEQIERLEQLRAIEKGIKIKVKETLFETIGVDTPVDIERIERCQSLSL